MLASGNVQQCPACDSDGGAHSYYSDLPKALGPGRAGTVQLSPHEDHVDVRNIGVDAHQVVSEWTLQGAQHAASLARHDGLTYRWPMLCSAPVLRRSHDRRVSRRDS